VFSTCIINVLTIALSIDRLLHTACYVLVMFVIK